MVVRLNRLAIAAIAVTMPLVMSQRAIAQDADIIAPGYVNTPAEAFNDAFFSNDPEYYRNRSAGEQLDTIFGLGGEDLGFLENEITRDGRAINRLTTQLLFEQAHSTPILRTVDLDNPFTTSLQSLDRIEPPELVPLPPARTRIVPTAPPTRPPAAVPALW